MTLPLSVAGLSWQWRHWPFWRTRRELADGHRAAQCDGELLPVSPRHRADSCLAGWVGVRKRENISFHLPWSNKRRIPSLIASCPLYSGHMSSCPFRPSPQSTQHSARARWRSAYGCSRRRWSVTTDSRFGFRHMKLKNKNITFTLWAAHSSDVGVVYHRSKSSLTETTAPRFFFISTRYFQVT